MFLVLTGMGNLLNSSKCKMKIYLLTELKLLVA